MPSGRAIQPCHPGFAIQRAIQPCHPRCVAATSFHKCSDSFTTWETGHTESSRLIRPSFNSTFGDLKVWLQLRLIRHSTFAIFTFFEFELRLIRHRYWRKYNGMEWVLTYFKIKHKVLVGFSALLIGFFGPLRGRAKKITVFKPSMLTCVRSFGYRRVFNQNSNW